MNDPKVPGSRTDRDATPTGRQAVLETDERSITRILQDMLANVQEIIRSEMRLAKTEISEEMSKAVRAFSVLAGGLVLGLYAIGFLLLTIVYALAAALPNWLGSLIVGVVVGIIGTTLIVVGRNRIRGIRIPQKTIASVKEDAQWVKDQTK